MYRTPSGERVLQGVEADLFRRLLDWLAYEVSLRFADPGMESLLNLPPYDRLTPGQQLWCLVEVGECLLREDVPACELTAFVEATLGAMRKQLFLLICYEIDDGNEAIWGEGGRSAREFLFEMFPPEDDPQLKLIEDVDADDQIENPECDNYDLWEELTYCWFETILWDDDFEDEHIYIDGPPEVTAAVLSSMDIPPNYYSAVPNDPRPEDLPALFERLKALTHNDPQRL